MADFVAISQKNGRTELINPAHVDFVAWEPTPDGRDGQISLRIRGEVRAVAFSDPCVKKVAETFGLADQFAAWPKAKAAADARYAEEVKRKADEAALRRGRLRVA